MRPVRMGSCAKRRVSFQTSPCSRCSRNWPNWRDVRRRRLRNPPSHSHWRHLTERTAESCSDSALQRTSSAEISALLATGRAQIRARFGVQELVARLENIEDGI